MASATNFKLIQKYGEIPPEEMYEIFNMGLGMILAVSPEHVEKFRSFCQKLLKLVVWYLGKRKPLFLRKPYEDSCFASGNGSNFEAIAAAFPRKIAGQLSLVFCDQPEAYVLTRAQNARFPLFAFRHLIFHLVSNMRNKY